MFIGKKIIVGSVIALVVVLTPVTVGAQVTDVNRQALLLQLISLLEIQLELLQSQLVDQLDEAAVDYPIADAVFFDDDSFLGSINGEIVARYEIDDMAIISPSRTHKEYVNRMADLLPDQYHHYFVELVVFNSSSNDIDAFVETTLPYEAQWRYGVNEIVFRDAINSELNSELLIHEFGHIFSLHEVFTTPRPSNCHEYFDDSGCVSSDTVYGKFLSEFWTDAQLDRAEQIRDARNQTRAIDRFYTETSGAFVSNYAASSPAEDFAESFSHFVLYDDESFGDIADQKVQFFNRFSNTRSMKVEILTNL